MCRLSPMLWEGSGFCSCSHCRNTRLRVNFRAQGSDGCTESNDRRYQSAAYFYFLSIFAALALLPDWMEVLILFVAPAVAIADALLLLPFISGTGEKSARRRPVAVLAVIFVMLVICVLTYMGETSPWSPKMEAWRAMPFQFSSFMVGRLSKCMERSCFRISNAEIAMLSAAWEASAGLLWTQWQPD